MLRREIMEYVTIWQWRGDTVGVMDTLHVVIITPAHTSYAYGCWHCQHARATSGRLSRVRYHVRLARQRDELDDCLSVVVATLKGRLRYNEWLLPMATA